MAAARQRLVLIDGFSNIFRAFYAIRDLSNSKGLSTNAIYGFVQMLRKVLREERPDLVGVALDVSEKTFRSERYEDYKANRAPMPEDLAPQLPWIRKAIEAFHIPVLELENYEADDVLGTLAKKAAGAGYDVVLVSADKDLLQLVDEHICLLHTGRDKLYDPEAVEEDFGVPPQRVVDVLALKGDSVDNIPGVRGIGDKGARRLIQEFGSLEELLERAGEVQRKSYRQGLAEGREQALLSKELVTIHTDLPLEFDPQDLKHEPPDIEALRELFRELEFFSLLEEMGSGAGPSAPLEVAVEEAASAAAWQRAAAGLAGEIHVALAGPASPIAVVAGGSEGAALLADLRRPGLRPAVAGTVAEWLADPGRRVAGHDLKEVLRLNPPPGAVAAELVDLMLASYLLRPSLHGHTLEEIAMERLQHQAMGREEAGWSKSAEPEPGSEGLRVYAGERFELARRLVPVMRAELEASGLGGVYREIEEPLLPVLVRMEEAGILLDVPYLEEMSRELARDLEALEATIYEIAGEEFNINSPQQLRVILFEKLGYPALKRTRKTKSYSTGAETLAELAARGYPLPEHLLRYRELAKLKSTYVDALPVLVEEDGRLHTRFQQAVAATGRLSSANPNLQNIPVRSELGQRIRRAFVAAPGYCLLVADYSQVELRVLAHIAGEEALLEAFRAGEDIHRATAAAVFGVAPEAVTGEQRRAAKVINFGILYGMSAYGLAQNLGIETGEADRFIRAYMDRYPGVKGYVDETLAAAEEDGRVETLYGRIRWLPDIRSKNWNLRENARRMAINARIQGTAADLLKKAMVAVDRRLAERYPGVRLLLTVHDELVFEVPEGEVSEVAAVVRQGMEGVADLAAPLVVEVGWGENWFEAKA